MTILLNIQRIVLIKIFPLNYKFHCDFYPFPIYTRNVNGNEQAAVMSHSGSFLCSLYFARMHCNQKVLQFYRGPSLSHPPTLLSLMHKQFAEGARGEVVSSHSQDSQSGNAGA